jgi:hypothetical protein
VQSGEVHSPQGGEYGATGVPHTGEKCAGIEEVPSGLSLAQAPRTGGEKYIRPLGISFGRVSTSFKSWRDKAPKPQRRLHAKKDLIDALHRV